MTSYGRAGLRHEGKWQGHGLPRVRVTHVDSGQISDLICHKDRVTPNSQLFRMDNREQMVRGSGKITSAYSIYMYSRLQDA